jgi:thiosulfate/3-mercaptopyruvate sulfurtransferase
MKIESPLVSVLWLKNHLEASNLLILNASIPKVTDTSDKISDEKLIPNTRFFDIKTKFSDTSAPFPSTFPSTAQFTKEAQLLGINKDSAIVIYDDKGIYSSARAWWLFKAFGHHNVAVLDGGLPEWKRLEYSLESYRPYKGPRGNFKASLKKELMKFFEDIKTESEDTAHIIIDARSSDRFNSLVDEPRKGLRRGTIPNSVNLPFEDLLDGNSLKPTEELKRIFSKVANPNDSMTFSCGSGITACVLALGAEISGYRHISVYDGSWTEWGSLMLV